MPAGIIGSIASILQGLGKAKELSQLTPLVSPEKENELLSPGLIDNLLKTPSVPPSISLRDPNQVLPELYDPNKNPTLYSPVMQPPPPAGVLDKLGGGLDKFNDLLMKIPPMSIAYRMKAAGVPEELAEKRRTTPSIDVAHQQGLEKTNVLAQNAFDTKMQDFLGKKSLADARMEFDKFQQQLAEEASNARNRATNAASLERAGITAGQPDKWGIFLEAIKRKQKGDPALWDALVEFEKSGSGINLSELLQGLGGGTAPSVTGLPSGTKKPPIKDFGG